MIDSKQLILNPLSRQEFPHTWTVLESGMLEGVAPGFVAGLWQNKFPDEIRLGAIGNRRTLPLTLPMTVDTVFDLASVTKVFSTATLAAVLVDRGWISWDSSVSTLL